MKQLFYKMNCRFRRSLETFKRFWTSSKNALHLVSKWKLCLVFLRCGNILRIKNINKMTGRDVFYLSSTCKSFFKLNNVKISQVCKKLSNVSVHFVACQSSRTSSVMRTTSDRFGRFIELESSYCNKKLISYHKQLYSAFRFFIRKPSPDAKKYHICLTDAPKT